MKKLFLMLLMSASAFAAGGFEVSFNIPVLISLGIPIGNTGEKRDVSGAANTGITAQLGYGLYLENGLGFSILGEVGYAFNQFANYYPNRPNEEVVYYSFHSLQLGLLPKFNIGKYAIGLGGGVKIPFSGYIMTYNEYSSSEINYHYKYVNFSYINNTYNQMFVIPYVKLTFDFYTPNFDKDSDKMDAGIGIYLGYDFGPKAKNNIGTDSFSIGAQFSFRLKPTN
ncbi:hypothetical protein BFL38_00340 [Brachyspira hampsonii]|uniref:Outer membrane protein beta-barrel domain-containing protein n=1 Tax=Brachyspira hampsonii TaxID=1287055 RepID=A0A1E5NA61_9SPIR|nr:hypothetical protein [Brachyspira hampsonii]OEJ13050.1 hypothetical protein BFL38_00340 [Brachyspira hampsonii]